MTFLAELKRRNVVRVGMAYVVAAWVVLQIGEVMVDALVLPPILMKIILGLAAAGLLRALVFAWV